jgi:hypothetical protein
MQQREPISRRYSCLDPPQQSKIGIAGDPGRKQALAHAPRNDKNKKILLCASVSLW